MKQKIFKIILILSFLPIVVTLLYGICTIFTGFNFFWSQVNGLKAFYACTGTMLVIFIIAFPLIPLCILYEIIYLIVFAVKNKQNFPKKEVFCLVTAIALHIILPCAILFS